MDKEIIPTKKSGKCKFSMIGLLPKKSMKQYEKIRCFFNMMFWKERGTIL